MAETLRIEIPSGVFEKAGRAIAIVDSNLQRMDKTLKHTDKSFRSFNQEVSKFDKTTSQI